ncbi:MAG: hypothetical protein J6328_04555, partial [Bacilli bacterium]|nr:hypothetical protein [Bacilli bacterium]
GLIDALAGVFPAQYVPFLTAITAKNYDDETYPDPVQKAKAAVKDLIECCAIGTYDSDNKLVYSADYDRYAVLTIVGGFVLSSTPNIGNLLLNGTHDQEGNPITKDAVPLTTLANDILTLVLPTDDNSERVSLVEGANQALAALLNSVKNEANGSFIDILNEHANELRKGLFAMFLNPQGEYSLAKDVENGYMFVDAILFLAPSHFHELYISYLKTKI